MAPFKFLRPRPLYSPEVQRILDLLRDRHSEWKRGMGPSSQHDALYGPCGLMLTTFCYEGCLVEARVGNDPLDLTNSEKTALKQALYEWEWIDGADARDEWRAAEAARKERIRSALLSDACPTG